MTADYMMTSSNENISCVTGPLWGNPPVTVVSHHKGQWSGALMFSLIWTDSWPNDRNTGDLRPDRVYYDVTVMWETSHYFDRQIAFSQISTIANRVNSQITKFMWRTWGPPGSYRPQLSPMLAPWTLLSGKLWGQWDIICQSPLDRPFLSHITQSFDSYKRSSDSYKWSFRIWHN